MTHQHEPPSILDFDITSSLKSKILGVFSSALIALVAGIVRNPSLLAPVLEN